MVGLERAKLKDRIIKLILEQNTNRFGINALDRELGSPTKPKAQLNLLIEEMINDAEGAFDYSGNRKMGYVINWNDFTQDFFDNDGFVIRYQQAELQRKKQLSEEQAITKDLNYQRKRNKWQARLAKWQVITFWPLFFIGIIGGGYSIYQIADKILNPKEVVTTEEFEQFKKELARKPEPVLKDSIK
jgi:hypothetical protein